MTARLLSELSHLKGTHLYEQLKQQYSGDGELILPTSLVLSADELRSTNIDEPEMLIAQLQTHPSTSLTHSETGVGKTRIMMHKAIALVTGSNFLCFAVPQRRRVLFVDGELPKNDMDYMLRESIGSEKLPGLDFISSEMVYDYLGDSLNLANEKHQEAFLDLLNDLAREERSPELIILDNNDTLFLDTDEDSNTQQQSAIKFLIHLRHNKISVDLVHHSGVSGRQRGATRRKDQMNLIVKLEDIRGEDKTVGAKLRWKFEKIRQKPEGLSEFECEYRLNEETGLYFWDVKKIKAPVHIQILQWISANQPVISQKQIIEGCPAAAKAKSTMSDHISTLRRKALMPKDKDNFSVTKTGKQELLKYTSSGEGKKPLPKKKIVRGKV